ncbi:PKD domain-containing protein [Methanoregula sp. PtaB.Bin085]|uniref:Kelch repeat-containing protein n=1 Tax=Methanoregula sp. PtaB.Bin085 TaxID=1811680 RepID=UPI0025DB9BE1|nr:PKD domain-containing protein [Methanoregula sp. PtaB.Bin085]
MISGFCGKKRGVKHLTPDKRIVLLMVLILASGIITTIVAADENSGVDNLTQNVLPEQDTYSAGSDEIGQTGSENLTFSTSDLSRVNTTKRESEFQSVAYAVSALAPVADFNATPRSGPAPLSVQFTDISTNSPTNWSWNFGDEWWIARSFHCTVVTANGTILVIGGAGDKDYANDKIFSLGNWRLYNDVWKSTDSGATWTLVNGSSAWSARRVHNTAVLPDGTILLIGGGDYAKYRNEVWRSSDQGVTWTMINANGGWTPRESMAIAVLSNDTIILSGGTLSGGYTQFNDVWRSTDKGLTWVQATANAPWQKRYGHTMTVLGDDSIILVGGYTFGGSPLYPRDTWRSTDQGTTWVRVSLDNGFDGRILQSSAALPDGSVILLGGISWGVYYNDTWKSIDNGATWFRVTANAPWEKRNAHTSTVMPDGSIVLMGGYDTAGGYKNDVWRSNDNGTSWTFVGRGPDNSPDQNPLHTYTKPGIYTVSMKATNTAGSNRKVKMGYVKVPPPVANFSANTTSGDSPLGVQFTDTSTGNPTSWNWLFGDGNSSVERNPSHIYVAAGSYNVSLTAANAGGSNTTVKAGYVVVTAPVHCGYDSCDDINNQTDYEECVTCNNQTYCEGLCANSSCDLTGDNVTFIINNYTCSYGNWLPASCGQNALLNWALEGDTDQFKDVLSIARWRRTTDCPNMGHSYVFENPMGKDVNMAGVTAEDIGHYHEVAAELPAGKDGNDYSSWRFFNYGESNITKGIGFPGMPNGQIPAGGRTCYTQVRIRKIAGIHGCLVIDDPPQIVKTFYIDRLC